MPTKENKDNILNNLNPDFQHSIYDINIVKLLRYAASTPNNSSLGVTNKKKTRVGHHVKSEALKYPSIYNWLRQFSENLLQPVE